MNDSDQNGAPVRLTGLTKRYGAGPAAVDDVSLDVAAGEFMTLLGPSGSGKTTTLNMIAGFVPATSGRIEVGGHDVARLPAHKRDLGMVFQHYALFPHMSVAKNVAFPLEQRRVPRAHIDERVEAALRLVQLDGMSERLPRQLSGGQQQRVAFARATVFQPPVLLMDEPLGALDRKLREQLQGEIARIHRELGITFVFVTHDQDEALALSDRVAVFNEGRIEQVGTARELYERPASLFVARFLGDSNVFTGRHASRGRLAHGDRELRVEESVSIPVGVAAAVVVRPERTMLLADDEPVPDGANAVPGTVVDITYFGSHRKVTVALDGEARATVREAAGAETSIAPCGSVRLTWPVDRGVLVAAPDAHADPVPATV